MVRGKGGIINLRSRSVSFLINSVSIFVNVQISFDSNIRKSGPISKWRKRIVKLQYGTNFLLYHKLPLAGHLTNKFKQIQMADADDKSCMIIGPCKGKKAKQRGQRGRTSPRDSNMSARFVSNKFCPALTENCC